MVNVFMTGGGAPAQGQGMEGWIDKLLPVAVLGIIGWLIYKTLFGGGTDTSGSQQTTTTKSPGTVTLTPTGTQDQQWTASGNLKGAVIESPSGFAKTLVQTFTGKGSPEPENILSGASWTRFAVALPKAQIPAWQPANLIPLQSGDATHAIAGQIAEYNPATGNAWGGQVETVKYLYTTPGTCAATVEERTAQINACRDQACVDAITACAWRATYA